MRAYSKGNTAWYIGFNRASNNINRWTLCSKYHVDTCSTRHLCQTTNGFFNVIWSSHHKVSQLVDNQYDQWHSCLRVCFIIALNITFTRCGKCFITRLHFTNGPSQYSCCFFHICYNWRHQMRDTIVNRQFNHLRVN